jgi:signal peptidase I
MAAAKEEGGFVETIKTIVYALLLAGLIRTLFFQPFWIPSSSMKSTLLIGDFLFVNKFAYGYSRYSCPFSMCPITGRILGREPERGDVIVFRHPVIGEDYIKRLIGLPGDKVQIKDGLIYLNGTQVPQVDDGIFTEIMEPQGPMGSMPRCANSPVGLGGDCELFRARETLPNGVTHTVLNINESASDNTGVFEVPEGHYFFMGDNRDNSRDSRFPEVGYVAEDLVVGKAVVIWLNWNLPNAPLWSRIGDSIH